MIGIIRLVGTQNFPKNYHFVLLVCQRGKKLQYFGKFCLRTTWVIPKGNVR